MPVFRNFRGSMVRSKFCGEFFMGRCVLILLWFLAGITAVPGNASSPSVVFDGFSKDLGRINQGEVARYVFSFSNKGPGTLDILSIETS